MGSIKVCLTALVLGVLFMKVENKAVQTLVKISQERLEKMLPIIAVCASENGLNLDIITKIKTKNYPADDQTKSFFLCGFTRTGGSFKNGTLNVDEFISYYPEGIDTTKIRPVLEECTYKQQGEPKNNIYNFYRCYEENSPVIMTLP